MDRLSQLTTALADRYRIERELGAGGMATVYLAHDLRHDRPVAIKVLHPELAAALGGERFLSEIKTTARLQHPHILPLLDSGEADGLLYYVMPYVPGETLRARLERENQLPIADALRIAREAADALGAAHAVGIIHRDIKPENILLQGGHALVADFGIALAVQSAGGQRMTQTGLSLGTPQYMSPEQAMGEKTVDARTDVYALGAVTYEMLTGEPPFTGTSVQAIVAKLLTDTPRPLTELRKSVPVHVESAVLAALEKLPADRIATAPAFASALEDTGFATTSRRTTARTIRGTPAVPNRWLWLALGLSVALAVISTFFRLQRSAVAPSQQRIVLWQYRIPDPLAPGARFVGIQAAIAPDGSSIVFADSTSDGYVLMRKVRESSEPVVLAGTTGGVSPFFSPDGEWIGYLTVDGKLKKVPVDGGGSITLTENVSTDYKAGAWLEDGTIVYVATRQVRELVRVSAAGAVLAPLRLPARGATIASVWPLPESRGVLFTACGGNCALGSSVWRYDFAGDSASQLVPRAFGVWYTAEAGQLLYTAREGGLFAMRFDPASGDPPSAPVPVLDGVEPGSFTLSASGAALFLRDPAAGSPSELVWVTRDGRTEPVDTAWHGRFEYPALSPDGRSLAVSLRERTTDLWIRQADGNKRRINHDGAANWRASWAPDGQSLTFVSVRNPDDPNGVEAWRVRSDGMAGAELVHRARYGIWETELSRDGAWLALRLDEEGLDGNVRFRRVAGDTALQPFLVDTSVTLSIALSPDSRWLAYTSNRVGQRIEIFVAAFPSGASVYQISNGGGTEPRWSRDGRELYFESGGRLMVVPVSTGSAFNAGTPRPLFSLQGYRRARNRPQYDVGPDGRFVMIRESGRSATRGVVYAENWFAELLARVRR
jgi:WD40 repeat protein